MEKRGISVYSCCRQEGGHSIVISDNKGGEWEGRLKPIQEVW